MKYGAKRNFSYTVLCSFNLEAVGFYINEEIETKLHYKDITLISVAFGNYIEKYGDKMDTEQKTRMNKLVNRLGNEMHNHPDNDKPNGH